MAPHAQTHRLRLSRTLRTGRNSYHRGNLFQNILSTGSTLNALLIPAIRLRVPLAHIRTILPLLRTQMDILAMAALPLPVLQTMGLLGKRRCNFHPASSIRTGRTNEGTVRPDDAGPKTTSQLTLPRIPLSPFYFFSDLGWQFSQ